MADIATSITLNAVGADQASAEIGKVSGALQNVTNTSSAMQSKFQERFQHIGLMLFAGDALRASGLGGEARMVVNTLNTALTAGGAAFGAAAGPAMLLVTALAAVAGMATKVIQRQKEESETLAKLADQQQKNLSSYEQEIGYLTRIAAAGGTMTGAMRQLLAADQAVAADIRTNLLQTQEKEIEALEKQRAELGTHQAVHDVWIKAMGLAKTAIAEIAKTIGDMIIPGISAFSAGAQTLVSHFSGLFAAVGKHVTLSGQFKQKYDELTAAIAKMKTQHANTAKGTTSDLKAMAAAAEAYRTDRIANEVALYREMQKLRDQDTAQERQQMDNRINQWVKTQQDINAEMDKIHKKQAEQAKQVAGVISSEYGRAFTDMIMDGKHAGQAIGEAIQSMARIFIQKVIEMTIEWILLREAMSIWPGGMGAFQATASAAYPGIAQEAYSGLNWGGSAALGSTQVVNQPTLFLAGEAGAEIANFTPVGIAGSGGGGGASIGTVNINLQVDHLEGNDPAGTLDMLSNEIRRETVAGRRFASTVSGVAGRHANQAY